MFGLVSFTLSLIALSLGCLVCIKACNTEACRSLMKFCAYFIILFSFLSAALSGYKMVKYCGYGYKGACPFHHKQDGKGMDGSMHHDHEGHDHGDDTDAGSDK